MAKPSLSGGGDYTGIWNLGGVIHWELLEKQPLTGIIKRTMDHKIRYRLQIAAVFQHY
jgi:hypothetical protein